jgi:hypothetical protein
MSICKVRYVGMHARKRTCMPGTKRDEKTLHSCRSNRTVDRDLWVT